MEDLGELERLPYESAKVSEMRVHEDAISYCEGWGRNHGYKIAILQSHWTDQENWKGIRRRLWLGCSSSDGHRRKNPLSETTYTSKKCGCPFKIMVTFHHDVWHVEYDDDEGKHCHE